MRMESNGKAEPSQEAVRGALQRLLGSRMFAQSVRLSRFLKFGVEAALAGRVSVNEYSIGIDVFEKKSNFDPRIDPIVRVHARRLRSKLKQYYETEGMEDPIEIGLPLRTYVPVFRARPPKPPLPKRPAGFGLSSEPADSIVVFPFTNLSPTREEENYFADGLTRELVHALSLVKEWRVVAWHTNNGEQPQPDLRELGKQLNVSAALWGTVRKAQKVLRISVELTGVPDGTVLWSQMYEIEIEDQVTAQERLSRTICHALRGRAETAGAGSAATEAALSNCSPQARKLYLQGRHLAALAGRENLERALRLLTAATVAAPQYAAALAALGETLVLLATDAEYAPSDVMPKAEQAAIRALECDPGAAEAHVVLGLVQALYEGDAGAAEKEFLRAMELSAAAPPLAWYAAVCLTPAGRYADAIECLDRARELDPVCAAYGHFLGFTHCAAGNPAAAIEVLEETLTVEPNSPVAHWALGIAYEIQSRWEKALEQFDQASRLSGGAVYARAGLGHAYASGGDTGKAVAILDELRERSRKRFVPAADLAVIHLGLAEYDQALRCLAAAAEQRCPWRYRLAVDPRTLSIRENGRFAAAMRRAGETATHSSASSITSITSRE